MATTAGIAATVVPGKALGFIGILGRVSLVVVG